MKVIGWSLFVVCVLFLCSIFFLSRLVDDKPIMRIYLTGQTKTELVEWKTPSGTISKENLTTYEVFLVTPKGTPIDHLYVYGDLVGIRAKVVRFTPFLNMVGISNLYHLDTVYNGYSTADRHNAYPHFAKALENSNALWSFWESIFTHESVSMWVKTATLESNYFPLKDSKGKPVRAQHALTINSGGLSSIALKYQN